jgi:uncharacterized protein with HEPN domain
MKPATTKRLRDVLEAGEEIGALIARTSLDDLRRDRLLQLAVLKLLEIVGEALNRARKGERHLESEIRHLRRFVNLRNQIVHDYDKVDLVIIWQVLHEGLPDLVSSVDDALGRDSRKWSSRHRFSGRGRR